MKGVGEWGGGGGIRFVGEGEQLIIYRPANHNDSIVYLNQAFSIPSLIFLLFLFIATRLDSKR